MEDIQQMLEKIGHISKELDDLEIEFEGLKMRYHGVDRKIRDMHVERKSLIKELMSICEGKQ